LDTKVEDIVSGQIEKSEEKLKAARSLLDGGFFDDAISRAYYAIFHAASAVLLSEEMTVESHSALKTVFGLRFIKTGRIDRRFGRILSRLKDDRENGDYDVFSDFNFQDAREAIEKAEEFLIEMKKFLGKQT